MHDAAVGGQRLEHLTALHAPTVPELIRLRAATHPAKVFVRLLDMAGGAREVSFAEFHTAVAAAALGLMAHGVRCGDVVPIVLDTSLEFLSSFFGTIAAGGIPVALPVPFTPATAAATTAAVARLRPSCIVTASTELAEALPHVTLIPPQDLASRAEAPLPRLRPPDAAMMQLSSGTTAQPKGVLLSHYNLLANCHMAGHAAQLVEADSMVSWLPLFHDMGLIGTVLCPLYYAMTTTLMPPMAFIMQPQLWLRAIGRYRASVAVAPNSAFEMCSRKLGRDDTPNLDLSSLRVMFCGAELVREHTLRRFAERLAGSGFRASAFMPVYGLAESTLAVAFSPLGGGLVVDTVEASNFAPGSRTVPSNHGTHFVGVGQSLPWQRVQLTDTEGRGVEEGIVGYVRIKSPSVMMGYYNDPQATAATKEDGWLKTSDLAYLRNGTLFICGRDSDLIIKAGRNLSPAAIEDACQRLIPDLLRLAAFGVYEEERGTEVLVLMAETKQPRGADQDRLRLRIRSALAQQCGIEVDHVWLVPPRTVPRTTSGKIQRPRCREMWKARHQA